jgi:hypothetical protein
MFEGTIFSALPDLIYRMLYPRMIIHSRVPELGGRFSSRYLAKRL